MQFLSALHHLNFVFSKDMHCKGQLSKSVTLLNSSCIFVLDLFYRFSLSAHFLSLLLCETIFPWAPASMLTALPRRTQLLFFRLAKCKYKIGDTNQESSLARFRDLSPRGNPFLDSSI